MIFCTEFGDIGLNIVKNIRIKVRVACEQDLSCGMNVFVSHNFTLLLRSYQNLNLIAVTFAIIIAAG